MADSLIRNSSYAKDANDKINVMIVDDALVIRGMLSRMLESAGDIDIVASVGDGERAVSALDRYKIDVVVLDIEMPRMDGLTALPLILKKCPRIQVIMASTLTLRNADISMKALKLGAADYLPKPTSSSKLNSATSFKRELIDKVRSLGTANRRRRLMQARAAGNSLSDNIRTNSFTAINNKKTKIQLRPYKKFIPDIITIGSSTGGPQALFTILKDIGTDIKQPILITQHMPPTFTTILAEHIEKSSSLPTIEASDGDIIKGGHIYIAPGDYHMLVEVKGFEKVIKLTQDPPENFCRPSVDAMLRSVSKVYGNKILTVILTGMGSDGCRSSKVIASLGGLVIAQDEKTSVVWGMPGSVSNAGICSAVLPLDKMAAQIKKISAGG